MNKAGGISGFYVKAIFHEITYRFVSELLEKPTRFPVPKALAKGQENH
jgi:hypothetical protein